MPKLLESLPESVRLSEEEWRTGLRAQLSSQIESTTAALVGERAACAEAEKLRLENTDLSEALQKSSEHQQVLKESNNRLNVTVERQQVELAELTATLVSAENKLSDLKDKAEKADAMASQAERQASELARLTRLLLATEQRLDDLQRALNDYVLNQTYTEEPSVPKGIAGKLKGKVLGQKPSGRKNAETELLKASPYFNEKWYFEQNPDVAEANIDPYQHYLENGADEGRDPSPLFCTQWYLSAYADVKETGTNPLVHFLRYGLQEGRLALPPVDKG